MISSRLSTSHVHQSLVCCSPYQATHELHSLSKASSLICRSLSSTSAATSGRNLIITFRMTTCMSCSGVSNSSIQQSKCLAVCGAWLSGPKPKSRLSDGIEVKSCDSSGHRWGRWQTGVRAESNPLYQSLALPLQSGRYRGQRQVTEKKDQYRMWTLCTPST